MQLGPELFPTAVHQPTTDFVELNCRTELNPGVFAAV